MFEQSPILMGLTASEIADLTKTIALVVGGGWALWTFQKLQKARLAEVDVRKRREEAQLTRAQREELAQRNLAQQPVLSIDLDIAHEDHESQRDEVVLNVVATLENRGSENLNVGFGLPTLTVGRLEFDARKVVAKDVRKAPPIFVPPESNKAEVFDERIFRVGQKRRMAFTISARRANTLFVQFQAAYQRLPFDGDKSKGKEGLTVTAIEQVFYRLADRQVSKENGDTRRHGLIGAQG